MILIPKYSFISLIVAFGLAASACTGDDVESVAVVELPANADGATIYAARCASCHGADLRGTDKGPSQLSIVYEPSHHGDDAYRSAIHNGAPQHHWDFGNMPAIENITDDQIEALISFIRTEQQQQGFEQ
jgi:mono/diheme cytochrome c family protein